MRKGVDGLVAVGLVMAAGGAAPAWAQGVTERASVGRGGVQADNVSHAPTLSAGGRLVAFHSHAANLVPGDTNGVSDVFLRDRRTRTTRRVSLGPDGAQADGDSFLPALSANGRLIAFGSQATNLVPGDTNLAEDVFVRNRLRGTTRRVSLGRGGTQGNANSHDPALSANGRLVAFVSGATNLVPGDTNLAEDVFVRNLRTGATRRVSLGRGGVQGDGGSSGPALSADGRLVAFHSQATNLVPGDTNRSDDVFVHDRRTGAIERVSVGPNGIQGDDGSSGPALSANGRFVAFTSLAGNLVPGDGNDDPDVFVRDRWARTTTRVSVGPGGTPSDGGSAFPALSADGRFVAFASDVADLVPGDTNAVADVFVRDRRKGAIRRVSVGPGGAQGDAYSGGGGPPGFSADGRVVAFESVASNLVRGDTNGVADVFVHATRRAYRVPPAAPKDLGQAR